MVIAVRIVDMIQLKKMKFEEILGLIIMVSTIVGIIILVYEDIKYNRKNRQKFIFLRLNNEYVRNILEGNGLFLCNCAFYSTNKYLYTQKDSSIHGFTEDITHLIEKAEKTNMELIDCGINIKKFIYEIQKLKSNEKRN